VIEPSDRPSARTHTGDALTACYSSISSSWRCGKLCKFNMNLCRICEIPRRFQLWKWEVQ
jgi:hypothetical protein